MKPCAFPGFQIGARGQAVWTAKTHARFKRRVREITRRNRWRRVWDVIDELRPTATHMAVMGQTELGRALARHRQALES